MKTPTSVLNGPPSSFPATVDPLWRQDQIFRQVFFLRLSPATGNAKRRFDTANCRLKGRITGRGFNGKDAGRAILPVRTEQTAHGVVVTPLSNAPVRFLEIKTAKHAKTLQFQESGKDPRAPKESVARSKFGFAVPKSLSGKPFLVTAKSSKPLTTSKILVAYGDVYRSAKLSQQGNALRVDLDAPRSLQSLVAQTSNDVDIFRLDGNTVAEKATTSLTIRPNVLEHAERLNDEVIAQGTEASIEIVDKPIEVIGATNKKSKKPDKTREKKKVGKLFNTLLPWQAFSAPNFLLRGRAFSLKMNTVKEVNFWAEAAAPRIGLADPANLEEATFFWWGEKKPGRTTIDLDASEDFSKALQTFADEAATDKPLEIAIVLEADAPCRFHLDDMSVDSFLRIDTFEDDSPKRIFSFNGKQSEKQTLVLGTPEGAAIRAAVLELQPSGLTPADEISAPESSTPSGLIVTDQAWSAARLNLEQPQRIQGFVLALAPLKKGKSLDLSVFKDRDNRPDGIPLAKASFEFPDEPIRLTWRWKEPQIIQRPIWLVLRCDEGRLVWPTNETDGGILFLDGNEPSDWQPRGYQAHLAARFAPLSTSTDVSITIAGELVPLTSANGKRYSANLTAPLQVEPDANLGITSAHAGRVTIYPPIIDFTLNG